jgi:hypothetical protein
MIFFPSILSSNVELVRDLASQFFFPRLSLQVLRVNLNRSNVFLF